MVHDNFSSNKDIESELYALIHTILNAFEKFEEGVINDNFFRRTVKNTIKELLKFNFYLNEEKIDLSLLLKKMNFTEQYYNAIRIINKLSSLELSLKSDENDIEDHTPISEKMSTTVLELPGITLEITSSFITLMDALKLRGLQESELIDNLFTELIKNMKKFPGLDNLHREIKRIYESVFLKSQYGERSNKSSEEIVDEIYQVFKEFHSKLNLKT
ncbi:MAG: hypothetical protein KGD65_12375 [Candidatus Lokiarchaeota archaeon]|nr:hypothetical protein [Candidatus Lokiarchaeota archaeon]